jgi:hypothetical protein
VLAARVGIPRLLPVALAAVLVLRIAAQNLGLPYTQELNYQSWCCEVEGNYDKARIVAKLEQTPGKHLVLVRAKTDEYNFLQWIYNDADIDGSRIVWARDLSAEKDAALVQYFHDRQVWMVDPNHRPATLELFCATASPVAAGAQRAIGGCNTQSDGRPETPLIKGAHSAPLPALASERDALAQQHGTAGSGR